MLIGVHVSIWSQLMSGGALSAYAVPAGAIQDRSGGYILDRSGNYIEVRA